MKLRWILEYIIIEDKLNNKIYYTKLKIKISRGKLFKLPKTTLLIFYINL